MKVINRQALVWPKGKPTKIKDLETLFVIMGFDNAVHLILGVLGFRPKKALGKTWFKYDWIFFLKHYIFCPVSGKTAEEEVIRVFNNVFVANDSYYHYLDKEWYV